MLTDRGREKLAEVKRVESLEAKIPSVNPHLRTGLRFRDISDCAKPSMGVDDEHKNYRSSGSI
ncbi:hypothetical protein P7H19_24645 [Paenibacillus larvae]|nr:hypothetical protein [Paenibacillus larvae]MDT2238824.1 hypothetical protein [Paenibacillus larvae]